MNLERLIGDDETEHALREAARGLPILGPFVRLIEYRNDADRLVSLAIVGIRGLVKWGEVADKIGWRADRPEDSEHADVVERLAAASSAEIERDFELLRAHAVVGLWGALEDFHDDLLIEWLQVKPGALRDSAIGANVNVPIGEYLARDDRGRSELVVSELKKTLRSDLQPGVGQFLPVLNELGLHGQLDPDVKKSILELQQTRHLWAHRAGIVDQRFLDACPWRNDVSIGGRLHVDDAMWHASLAALSKYSATLLDWVETLGGDDLKGRPDGEPAPT